MGKGDIVAQAHQVVSELRQVLENADDSLGSLLKITTYMTDIKTDIEQVQIAKKSFIFR